jgi:predicted PurR-regulated permease PerM
MADRLFRDDPLRDFAARAVIAASVIVAAIALWRLSDVLLVIFASILLAIAWRAAAKPLETRLKLPRAASMAVAALTLTAIFGSSITMFGSRLLAQYDEVARDIPRAIAEIRQAIEAHPWGRYVESFLAATDISRATAPLAVHVASFVGAVSQTLAFTLVILLGGACLALDPPTYIDGVIALAPASRREGLDRFMNKAGLMLQQWLRVQIFVVVVNTTLAFLGLWVAGVEAPLALATISGLLAFIPFLGSWVALIIGAIAVLPQGAEFAAYAVAAIGGASFIEGYLLTPYVQSKTLSLPPAALIFSMSAMGLLFGAFGVILAAPITIVLAAALASTRPQPDTLAP